MQVVPLFSLCHCGSGLERRELYNEHRVFAAYVCDSCQPHVAPIALLETPTEIGPTRRALLTALHYLTHEAFRHPENSTAFAELDEAVGAIQAILEQRGCREPFGEADTLPEFIDTIVYG